STAIRTKPNTVRDTVMATVIATVMATEHTDRDITKTIRRATFSRNFTENSSDDNEQRTYTYHGRRRFHRLEPVRLFFATRLPRALSGQFRDWTSSQSYRCAGQPE